ncbi:hypothetical protein D049_3062B, partial [Vibrio parahaemolyticus VPTS-2010]
EYPVS